MPLSLKIYFASALNIMQSIAQVIFPEFPFAAFIVCVLAVILLIFYTIKSGIGHALKISLLTLAVLSFFLFSIHTLAKIFK